ncbi:MAG: SGNH/GDSL hydrolase family protein [Candidatus Thiodiazotropha sp.]|jgi:lysophospholipase L1-like esterase
MIKKLLGNSLLVVFSLVFSFALCEIVVRMLDLAPEIVYVEKWRVRLSDNPVIGYEPIPNLNDENLSVRYYGYRGASNNMGYRDYDHNIKKTPGSRRVAVIGDSVTAGLWVNDDDMIFTRIMEKRLNTMGFQSDVMNFGVSGYNTRQEVETLKVRGLQYKPDIVVVAYCLNDRWQDDGNILGLLLEEERKVADNRSLSRARVNPIVKHSAFLRMVTYKVLPALFTRDTVAPEKSGEAIKQFYRDTVEDAFAELSQLSKSHGFEVLLTVFPDFGKQDKGLEGEYVFAEEHKKLAEIAAKNGFYHFDLLETFRDCKRNMPKGRTISYDRYHPNPVGNRCAGYAIAEKVGSIWSKN